MRAFCQGDFEWLDSILLDGVDCAARLPDRLAFLSYQLDVQQVRRAGVYLWDLISIILYFFKAMAMGPVRFLDTTHSRAPA